MDVKTPLIIRELCGQRIQQFINGLDFVLAMNEDNHVFSWGYNHRGQCARHVTAAELYLKPQLISQLNDKNIAYICCGGRHSLALTTDGKAYGWGDNALGQIGCGWGYNIVTKLGHNSHENHYKSLFIELSAIGSGGFGTFCLYFGNHWPNDSDL
ncbi:unnamed protein product [Oppiella nova]|uniref:Uncharacterized protein n=1 Tax=Oppiella nova TaxID=334625 RepID=A0A7R9QT91_9ACAR|nr:unnamed protein product [Oppiella nova]CAG2173144.1 unnamed protein product [Oppiella nova]